MLCPCQEGTWESLLPVALPYSPATLVVGGRRRCVASKKTWIFALIIEGKDHVLIPREEMRSRLDSWRSCLVSWGAFHQAHCPVEAAVNGCDQTHQIGESEAKLRQLAVDLIANGVNKFQGCPKCRKLLSTHLLSPLSKKKQRTQFSSTSTHRTEFLSTTRLRCKLYRQTLPLCSINVFCAAMMLVGRANASSSRLTLARVFTLALIVLVVFRPATAMAWGNGQLQEGPSGLSAARHLTAIERDPTIGTGSTKASPSSLDEHKETVSNPLAPPVDDVKRPAGITGTTDMAALAATSTAAKLTSAESSTYPRNHKHDEPSTLSAKTPNLAITADSLRVSNGDGAIDFVLTWWDRDDPATLAAADSAGGSEAVAAMVGGRQGCDGTVESLRTALRSFAQHAPFVRRVHLVTPLRSAVPTWINTNPGVNVNVVPHEVLFADRAKADAPNFNPAAVEARLADVPGLSERFCLFQSDNMVLTGDVTAADFFTNDGRAKLFLENSLIDSSHDTTNVGSNGDHFSLPASITAANYILEAHGAPRKLGLRAVSAMGRSRLDHVVPMLRSTLATACNTFAEPTARTAHHRIPRETDVSTLQLALITGIDTNDVAATHWHETDRIELCLDSLADIAIAKETLDRLESGALAAKLTRVIPTSTPFGSSDTSVDTASATNLAINGKGFEVESIERSQEVVLPSPPASLSLSRLFYEPSKYER